MNGAWSAIASAFELVPPDCYDARFHIEMAKDLAFLYQETWHSIWWNDSKVARRKGVQDRLDAIAYDTYSALIYGAQALNKYVEDGNELPENWGELIHCMNSAYRRLHDEHSHQLNQKQMTLPLDGQPVSLPLVLKVPDLILVEWQENNDTKHQSDHHPFHRSGYAPDKRHRQFGI